MWLVVFFVVLSVAVCGSVVLLIASAWDRRWGSFVVFLLALVVGAMLFGAALQAQAGPVGRDVALAASVERGVR